MVESPRRGELRLSIPADAAFHALAAELATRFAEYSGAAEGPAHEFGQAVTRMAARMTGRQIDLAMERDDRVVTARAQSGAATDETSCPLAD